jgi:hypothetical protein
VVGEHHVDRVDLVMGVAVVGDPVAALVFAELPGAIGLVGRDLVDPAVEFLRSAGAEPAQ